VDGRKTIAAAAALALTLTVAYAKGRKRPAEPEPKATGAVSVKLRAIDLQRRHVLVEVGGLSKPPLANFFTFTDERGRHFVSMTIHCDEPFPSGTQVCQLEIPAGYERHKLASLILHLHGLHGKPVAVDPEQVESAWEAATALVVADGGISDGGE
jgi:hypothetical protein